MKIRLHNYSTLYSSDIDHNTQYSITIRIQISERRKFVCSSVRVVENVNKNLICIFT